MFITIIFYLLLPAALLYSIASLILMAIQKKSGVLYKHNHTIPVGATYTSKKHNQAFSSINNKNRVSFPETIDGDEYYFCQNKYVFNNNSWQSILIRDSKNVLLEINGYNVLTKK